ncbi:MAG: PAS domain S-box protein [Desulfobulbaceae bacterium]|nr:PAS domain S-box protein [Desulfobulbaceae bacterium]
MSQRNFVINNECYALIIVDINDNIVTWNEVAERLFGWSSAKALGRKLSKTIFSHSALELYQQSLIKKDKIHPSTLQELKNKVWHCDGYDIPIQLIISKLDTPQGIHFLINAFDNNEQIRREKDVRNSLNSQKIMNSILQLTLKNISPDIFCTNVLELICSFDSLKLEPKGAVFLTDNESGELILHSHIGMKPEQVQACSRISPGVCHCGRALETGEVQFASFVDERHNIHYRNIEHHGHYCIPIHSGDRILGVIALYVREGHSPRSEEQETLIAISNIFAGVIERKKMESQRASLVDRLHSAMTAAWNEKLFTNSIIESLNHGLLVLDPDGIVTMINPLGREILNYFTLKKSIIGHNLKKIFIENIAICLMDPTPLPTGMSKEITLTTIGGEDKVIGYNTVPRKDSQGQELGYIISLTDFTEIKRTQREMEKMNHLITVAEIASAVAHEVRNPLAGIKTMSQSIEENMDPDDENREYLTRIIRQVDRLNELLTNFFTFAKPVTPKRTKVSVIEIINETKQLVRKKLKSRNIKLYEKYDNSLPQIYADLNQVQQVFLNLMLNSIEAIEHDGIIDIKASFMDSDDDLMPYFSEISLNKKPEDYVKIIFTDNGCGMSEETREKAFKPFFSTKAQGTGLGLSIVYRILQENNAFILLDPDVLDGASFIMFFER